MTAHNGFVTLAAVLLAGVVLAVAAYRPVPTLGHSPLPLGMLAPPVIALFSGLGVSGTLPVLRHGCWRVRLARAGWLGAVVATAAGAAAVVDAMYPVPGVLAATVELTGLTYGSAVVLGRSAVVTGAAVAIAVVADARSFAGAGTESWSDLGWPGVVLAAAGVLGALLYVVRGPRGHVVLAG